MKSVDPLVYVVVLNWNGAPDTVACLDSLRQLDYGNSRLLVVDNGSTDDSEARIRAAHPDVELLQSGANLGFGGGCNVGMAHALAQGADYVWLVNSDATVDPAALRALVDAAQSNARVGAVGSVLFDAREPGSQAPDQVQLWGGGRVSLWWGRTGHCVEPSAVDFVSGASVLLRRAALEQVGCFDAQRYFMYWEDTDLGFRLRQAGWQLAVAPGSRLWHKQSASLGQGSPQLDRYMTQSGVRFFRRHAPRPWVPVTLLMTRLLLKRLVLGRWSCLRAVWQGFRSA
jgi:GT2 family glycosyltransferase